MERITGFLAASPPAVSQVCHHMRQIGATRSSLISVFTTQPVAPERRPAGDNYSNPPAHSQMDRRIPLLCVSSGGMSWNVLLSASECKTRVILQIASNASSCSDSLCDSDERKRLNAQDFPPDQSLQGSASLTVIWSQMQRQLFVDSL